MMKRSRYIIFLATITMLASYTFTALKDEKQSLFANPRFGQIVNRIYENIIMAENSIDENEIYKHLSNATQLVALAKRITNATMEIALNSRDNETIKAANAFAYIVDDAEEDFKLAKTKLNQKYLDIINAKRRLKKIAIPKSRFAKSFEEHDEDYF